jgi:SAM-dependent methyltransferase
MSREERDQALYDAFAQKQARKDVLPASRLARQAELEAAVALALPPAASLGTVLEIGCGIAAPARYLNGRYDRYIGVDQSAEMIQAAHSFHGYNPRLDLLAQNIKQVDLPDHRADVVLSIGAMHHMSDLDEVMDTLRRLAKPGALMITREPQNGNPLIQLARWLRGHIDASYSQEQIFFSQDELLDLFRRHGFHIKVVAFHGYFGPPFAQLALPLQPLMVRLSRLAVIIDRWLHRYLPRAWQRLSFNIIIVAQFPEVT